MKLKKDDTVEVITGVNAGKRGRVLNVDRENEKVLIEGINICKKHVRRSQRNPQGGRLSKEMPLQASNVMLVCPKCQKATRVGIQIKESGEKNRVCKKCNTVISSISQAKKTAVK